MGWQVAGPHAVPASPQPASYGRFEIPQKNFERPPYI